MAVADEDGDVFGLDRLWIFSICGEARGWVGEQDGDAFRCLLAQQRLVMVLGE